MTDALMEKVFMKNRDIVSRQIAGETILVPVRGTVADMQRIFVLNPVGEYIWGCLDGQMTLLEIRDKVLAAFEVDAARAEADVSDFITELVDAGLVKGAD